MSRAAAKAPYDKGAGEPDSGYITPADPKMSVDVIYDDMEALSAAAVIPRITGSPEGVRAGNPGDQVIQTDATTDVKGFIRWIKTGTGNTGWIAGPEADTGWRNVAASINADWALDTGAGSLMIRRVGSVVSMAIGIQRVTASGARNGYSTVYTVPTGFLWKSNDFATWAAYNDSNNIAAFFKPYYSNAQLDLIQTSGGTYTAGESVWAKLTWTTTDAWPSSLPGSAA